MAFKMRIGITGSGGFLGWHTMCYLRTYHPEVEIVRIPSENLLTLDGIESEIDCLLHIAGVNRGTDDEVLNGNIALARGVAAIVQNSDKPISIIYANSISAGQPGPYGEGKKRALEILVDSASSSGVSSVNLPNLFGEHGKANYNSFVATFVQNVLTGEKSKIVDRDISLLHVQDAANLLIQPTGLVSTYRPVGLWETNIQSVHALLSSQWERYATGHFPDLESRFDLNVFNTLRAASFETRPEIHLQRKSDERGYLFEASVSKNGACQSFVSLTQPGFVRGNHFHASKVERFVVLKGQAEIKLKKLFTDQVLTFKVSEADSIAIDMPTFWSHNITNTGNDELFTYFWSDGNFDPEFPDTFPDVIF